MTNTKDPHTMNTEFNYDHLTPLEPAARIFCGMNGQDADEQMAVRHPLGLAVPFTRPAWHFAAEQMLNLSQMLTAMRQAAQTPAAEPKTDPRQRDLFSH